MCMLFETNCVLTIQFLSLCRLGCMKVPWSSLSPVAVSAIERGLSNHIEKFTALDLTNTVNALVSMGVRYNDLTVEMQQMISRMLSKKLTQMSNSQATNLIFP